MTSQDPPTAGRRTPIKTTADGVRIVHPGSPGRREDVGAQGVTVNGTPMVLRVSPGAPADSVPRWGRRDPIQKSTRRRKAAATTASFFGPTLSPDPEPEPVAPAEPQTLNVIAMAYGHVISRTPGAELGDWVSVHRVRARLAMGLDRALQDRLLVEAHNEGVAELASNRPEELLATDEREGAVWYDGEIQHLIACNPTHLPNQLPPRELDALVESLKKTGGRMPEELLDRLHPDALRQVAFRLGVDQKGTPDEIIARCAGEANELRKNGGARRNPDEILTLLDNPWGPDPFTLLQDADADQVRRIAEKVGVDPEDGSIDVVRSRIIAKTVDDRTDKRADFIAKGLVAEAATDEAVDQTLGVVSDDTVRRVARKFDINPDGHSPEELRRAVSREAANARELDRAEKEWKAHDEHLASLVPDPDAVPAGAMQRRRAWQDKVEQEHGEDQNQWPDHIRAEKEQHDAAVRARLRRPGRIGLEATADELRQLSPAQREEYLGDVVGATESDLVEHLGGARSGVGDSLKRNREVILARLKWEDQQVAAHEGEDDEDIWFNTKMAEARALAHPDPGDYSPAATRARDRLAEMQAVFHRRGLDPAKPPAHVEIDDETMQVANTTLAAALSRMSGNSSAVDSIRRLGRQLERRMVTIDEFLARLEQIEKQAGK